MKDYLKAMATQFDLDGHDSQAVTIRGFLKNLEAVEDYVSTNEPPGIGGLFNKIIFVYGVAMILTLKS